MIFVAELGDKSQLMALAFATRYSAPTVLVGISVATLIVHAGSVLIGRSLAAVLPFDVIAIVAALSFFAFRCVDAARRLARRIRGGQAARVKGTAVLAVGVAFFLAELGDKTMLATVALGTREEPIGTWLGSTVGHGPGRRAGNRGGQDPRHAPPRTRHPLRRGAGVCDFRCAPACASVFVR